MISGYAFSSGDFQSSGIPVIKISNIRVGNVDLSETQYVDPKFLSLDAKYHVKSGDVLISLTGSHVTQPNSVVGRVAYFRDSISHCLLNQRAGKAIVRNSSVCDPRFLFYALRDPKQMQRIATLAHGAASQANVSPKQVESLQLNLPPIRIQRQIASILSAYDDLSENNTRRIEILEQMAQMLYREWFVNFRFPGHEKIEMVDSQLGLIPDGWAIEKVGSRFTTVLGGTPSRSKPEFWESGTIPWINSGEVNKLRVIEPSDFITSDALSKSSAKVMPKRATVVAITGATLGQVCSAPH